ncbi:MAG: hypothetical protein HUU55_23510 [Myxococcales bacterium]|nr:hypothetical protein [Myxococcales bacterium]
MSKLLLIISVLLISQSALAGPDLSTTWLSTSPAYVYDLATYQVRVTNVGNQNASNVALTIQLPQTHTSPQVYILGNLGSFSASCSLGAGQKLNCSLGQIKRNKNVTVFFNLALPQNSVPISISATASTAGDNNPTNDTAQLTPNLLNDSVVIVPPATATNRHCTGTGLTSFFECELFPSSITEYPFTFEAGGSMTFPTAPSGISGVWSQPGGDQRRLYIEYYDGTTLAAIFDGWGSSDIPGCFEGVTVFPDGMGGYSPYVSPYEICLD